MIDIPRLARKDLDTSFLHVMVQGINKEYIFPKSEYIETYLRLLHLYMPEYHITLLAYCIMNNHAHLLVHVEQIENLGKFMHKTNLIYSQFYNKQKNRFGVVFRNKYQAEPIYNQKHLLACIKYIHMNPVKAKMVKSCRDYPYSSYNNYINNTGICKNNTFKEILGNNCDYQQVFNSIPNNIFIDINPPQFNEISSLMDARLVAFS